MFVLLFSGNGFEALGRIHGGALSRSADTFDMLAVELLVLAKKVKDWHLRHSLNVAL